MRTPPALRRRPDPRRGGYGHRTAAAALCVAVVGAWAPTTSAHAVPAAPASGVVSAQVQVRSGAAQVKTHQVKVPRPGRYTLRLRYQDARARAVAVRVEGRSVAVITSSQLSYTAVVTDGALTVSVRSPQGAAVLGDVRLVSAPPAPPTVRPAAAPPRDLRLHPFSRTSVWNLPIATTAAFEPATSSRTASLRTVGTAWANEDTYSHPVVQARHADPLRTVTDTNDASRSASYRIPAAAVVARGDDRHLHVIDATGTSVDEMWAAQRSADGGYRVGRHERVDLRGNGIGPTNGTRAYGGSAIGGLIRAWEVDPTHPAYTGRIEHALAIALRSDQLVHTGGAPGYVGGHGTARGYVWPATEQDWDSPWSYSGPIPMGTYVAIPGSVDLAALGLTPQGLMLARAYQQYGAYVTDRSGDPILAYVEPSPAGKAFTLAILGPSWTARDLNAIRAQLRIVSNNTAGTPNGGPIGAPRRAGLAA